MKYSKFQNTDVEKIFMAYPKKVREKMMFLRQLIFSTASETEGVGLLEETIKWGEPSYVTSESKSGSTIRINWKPFQENQYFFYFNCKTTLVDTIKEIFGDRFEYSGNRSISFNENAGFPVKELRFCISLALTYHLRKKQSKSTQLFPS